MPVSKQIALGKLVCPVSRESLREEGASLVSTASAYPVLRDVPLLIVDREAVEGQLREGAAMVSEYTVEEPGALRKAKAKLQRWLARGYRTKSSLKARETFLAALQGDALVLSVGGGPYRSHPGFVNVNIGPFPNVDVVADAYHLPYADNSVDGIHCDSVLEHLKEPGRAVQEMLRVLKPGGRVLAVTPFLIAYHGYPNHFQNLTLNGHELLFERRGFSIDDSGVCIGPFVGLADQVFQLLRRMTPRLLWKLLRGPAWVACEGVKLLDPLVRDKPWAHELACATFVLAVKPAVRA